MFNEPGRTAGIVVIALFVVSAMLTACRAEPARAAGHAVILLYHHVSDDTPASTSVSPAQFERHLDYIADNGYRVWPLERALNAVFDESVRVPDKVVAITFDDAYESVHSQAWPRLADRGWPFSVFVNTDAIDAGHAPYMSWDQLRELAAAGAGIGNHSATHGHLAQPEAGESADAWKARVEEDIARAHARIEQEIGAPPAVFAYPYGEDSTGLAEVVGRFYRFALVQRSGAVGPTTNPLAIPRFPLATGFDSLERIERALRTRPLPVSAESVRPEGSPDPETVRLELGGDGFRLTRVACFTASGRQLDVRIDPGPPPVVTVDIAGSSEPGRNKVNCTAPAEDGSGDYYWHSVQWIVGEDG